MVQNDAELDLNMERSLQAIGVLASLSEFSLRYLRKRDIVSL